MLLSSARVERIQCESARPRVLRRQAEGWPSGGLMSGSICDNRTDGRQGGGRGNERGGEMRSGEGSERRRETCSLTDGVGVLTGRTER